MSNKQILKNMKNQKQQTTVEWIEQEMLKGDLSMKQILEQAKEMFMEQIEKTYDDGIMKGRKEDGQQYYEQTYGGNK
jgi:hypothetical protein